MKNTIIPLLGLLLLISCGVKEDSESGQSSAPTQQQRSAVEMQADSLRQVYESAERTIETKSKELDALLEQLEK